MNTQHILVISKRPIFCEGLKLIIEKAISATVTTAPNGVNAAIRRPAFTPNVIIIDRPDTAAVDLKLFFQHEEYPAKVVVIGWNDDKIAVYSRSTVQPATIQNLIKVVRNNI